jgi:O-acetyl-ADP-ribose deacetylase (regulator of RNase III)
MFKIKFVDTDQTVVTALMSAFKHDATYALGKFEELTTPWDAIISAGNSFGIMDGGVDLAVRNFFGPSIQETVQNIIRVRHFGEQPVGTAAVVPTKHKDHPWVVYAPTMSMPQPIAHTHNVYYAMLASLHAIATHNKQGHILKAGIIKEVICTGLGTLTGKVPPPIAATQMRLAYENFMDNSAKMKTKWEDFK